MERLIQLDNLNMQEALRYLGSGGQTPDDAFMALMKDCEKTVLAQARPRYVYRIFDIRECEEGVCAEGTDFILRGNSIKQHFWRQPERTESTDSYGWHRYPTLRKHL